MMFGCASANGFGTPWVTVERGRQGGATSSVSPSAGLMVSHCDQPKVAIEPLFIISTRSACASAGPSTSLPGVGVCTNRHSPVSSGRCEDVPFGVSLTSPRTHVPPGASVMAAA